MGVKRKYRTKKKVLRAWLDTPPPFASTEHLRGDKRAGISFERLVGEALHFAGLHIISNVWVKYETANGTKLCSPDHLIFDFCSGTVTVVECKLSHTASAWYQLNNVYLPVVKKLFPEFEIRGLEVCKNFDNTVRYPRKPILCHDVAGDYIGGDNVLVWK